MGRKKGKYFTYTMMDATGADDPLLTAWDGQSDLEGVTYKPELYVYTNKARKKDPATGKRASKATKTGNTHYNQKATYKAPHMRESAATPSS